MELAEALMIVDEMTSLVPTTRLNHMRCVEALNVLQEMKNHECPVPADAAPATESTGSQSESVDMQRQRELQASSKQTNGK